jgi:hypothetical protein
MTQTHREPPRGGSGPPEVDCSAAIASRDRPSQEINIHHRVIIRDHLWLQVTSGHQMSLTFGLPSSAFSLMGSPHKSPCADVDLMAEPPGFVSTNTDSSMYSMQCMMSLCSILRQSVRSQAAPTVTPDQRDQLREADLVEPAEEPEDCCV